MSKYIEVESFLDSLTPDPVTECGCPEPEFLREMADLLREAHAADVMPVVHGEWTERDVFESHRIEMQSAKCSVCGRYHASPYLYYFTDYPFCPWCGAKLKEKVKDETD